MKGSVVSPLLRPFGLLLALAALFSLEGVAVAGDGNLKVIADGLDNPRGIAVGPRGSLYVTEAGRGGSAPCVPAPEGEGLVCAGKSGAVTKVAHGKQRRVLTGLPSTAGPEGSEATGPQDIALRRGRAHLVVGLAADPAVRAKLGAVGARLGRLYKISRFGRLRAVADLAGFEATENPDANQGGLPDSNPTSVISRRGRQVVVDAGGNDLLRVRRGRISTLAVFPFRAPSPGTPGLPPLQPVPTSVARGPDGAYYVSELTGFPFPVGGARIYRVVPGSKPEVIAGGFTNVIDLAFGPHGRLYVLEIAANGLLSGDPTGALIKVGRDGSRKTVASEGLVSPTGLAIDRKGAIFVSNHGTSAAEGQVVRVKPGR
jgi:hypothetical protein